MAIEASLPTLTTIVVTGVIDSVNPCAIGVMILLLSTLLATKQKKRMVKVGLMYVFAVFITYLAFGLGLTTVLSSIPIIWAEYISIVVGSLVVLAGLLEIKDYFWYGKGFSLHIPKKYAKMIKERMTKLSASTVIFLGIFVAAVELPCTGGPYLAVTLILAQNFNFTAVLMLLLYNVIFVLPLIIILVAVLLGTKVQHLLRWKQGNKAYMRYATGLLMIALGWMLMLIASGVINLN